MEPLIAEWKLYETAEDETRMEPLIRETNAPPLLITFFFRTSSGNLVPLNNDADLVSHIINFCILNDLLSLSKQWNP